MLEDKLIERSVGKLVSYESHASGISLNFAASSECGYRSMSVLFKARQSLLRDPLSTC